MKNKIVEMLGGKVHRAVEAMILGLEKMGNTKWFEVDMGTYGANSWLYKRCIGCAATCSLVHVAGKTPEWEDLVSSETRGEFVGATWQDIENFEETIDALRRGETNKVFELFGYNDLLMHNVELPKLETHNWKEGLPAYKEFHKYLLEKNI